MPVPTFFLAPKKEEKRKLANQGELEIARTDQPKSDTPILCPYNELHSDGTIVACKLPVGHEGNHELVVSGGQVTYTFTFHLSPTV